MTYQEALVRGTIKEGDYFLVKYPDGREVLFRLVKKYSGEYVMWGPPTEGKILLEGKEGYDNLFDLADAQARKEYFQPETFEEVHACGLPEKEYTVNSYEEYERITKIGNEMYGHPDDIDMLYVLASRCINLYTNYCNFYVRYVSSGSVNATGVFGSNNGAYSYAYAVRPEAIPKSRLLLETEGRTGSKSNPWVCLNAQGEMQEADICVADELLGSMDKAELIELIQKALERLAKM